MNFSRSNTQSCREVKLTQPPIQSPIQCFLSFSLVPCSETQPLLLLPRQPFKIWQDPPLHLQPRDHSGRGTLGHIRTHESRRIQPCTYGEFPLEVGPLSQSISFQPSTELSSRPSTSHRQRLPEISRPERRYSTFKSTSIFTAIQNHGIRFS